LISAKEVVSTLNMELIERLEARFEELLTRIRQLEEENRSLAARAEAEAGRRKEVQDRIEALLAKVQASLEGR
jgi:cell division protein ZapB